MFLSFQVIGKPQPAGSKKNVPTRKLPVTVYSMRDLGAFFPLIDDNDKSKAWKKTVKSVAAGHMLAHRLAKLEGPLYVQMLFRRERPVGHFRADGVTLSAEGLRHEYPTTKPDVLKLARAIEDAMTKTVYEDDAQIVSENIRKEWGDTAGVAVYVMQMDGATAVTPPSLEAK